MVKGKKWFLTLLFFTFVLFGSAEKSLGQEEIRGPFSLKDHVLKTPNETFVLRDDVKVVTSSGKLLSPDSLPFARLIRVYKDAQGRVKEIVILGWED